MLLAVGFEIAPRWRTAIVVERHPHRRDKGDAEAVRCYSATPRGGCADRSTLAGRGETLEGQGRLHPAAIRRSRPRPGGRAGVSSAPSYVVLRSCQRQRLRCGLADLAQRSVWWKGSGRSRTSRMVFSSYDQVPSAFAVTRIRYSVVWYAFSRNGFEQMLRCPECAHEKLVAFSCKRRGFCPSCGARRMAQSAAHLVDCVIPRVPVRQWVLSFPIPLRVLFAAHPELLSSLLQIIHRVIATFLLKPAGLQRAQAHTGAVTLIQRFARRPISTFICIAWCSMACIAAARARRCSM